MSQNDIQHFVFFPFPPAEVFELLTDEAKHAAFSGAPAKIDRRIGGKFSVFGGKILGVTTELKAASLIVQDWRAAEWPGEKSSCVSFALDPAQEGRGCALTFRHTGIPLDKVAETDEGWRKYYWNPMAEYLRSSKVAMVRRFLDEFKNQANLDIVDETWTEDCVLHVAGFEVPPGRAGQKQVGKVIFSAFTKVHVDVVDTIVEGDRVVERHHAAAVHTGEFMGIQASGKKVHWTENHIYRMKDGLIAEAWSEVSFHDLLAQISGAKSSAA